MSRPAGVAAALLATLTLTACIAPSNAVIGKVPACTSGEEGTAASGVVLMAQSVPTASQVPCVQSLPLGWRFAGLEAGDGGSRFWLDSDRDGAHAIEVQLAARCDTSGATEIPSDREDMRRLERVLQVAPVYHGSRHYLFDGGCLTVVFRLTGDNRAEPLALVTQGIRTVSREALAEKVVRETGGRLHLDPPDDAGGAR